MKKMMYFVTVLLLIGCENVEIINTPDTTTSTETTVTSENTAPVANAGADKTVTVFGNVEIIGSGTDSDGQIVDYEWKEDGQLISGLKDFTYFAESEGNFTLTLTVVDDDGLTASDTMLITVKAEVTTSI